MRCSGHMRSSFDEAIKSPCNSFSLCTPSPPEPSGEKWSPWVLHSRLKTGASHAHLLAAQAHPLCQNFQTGRDLSFAGEVPRVPVYLTLNHESWDLESPSP